MRVKRNIHFPECHRFGRHSMNIYRKIKKIMTSSPKIHLAQKEFLPEIPPVILLHGLTYVKETWDACAKVIANRTGSKVYSYDARNHGDSDWSDDHSFRAMADDLLDFMNSIGIPKAILVGHSMGGKTSMDFALRFPERVHSMVIEDISLSRIPSTKEFIVWYLDRMKKFLKEIPPNTELLEAKRMAVNYLSGQDQCKYDMSSWRKVWGDGSDLPLIFQSGRGFEWKINLETLEESKRNEKVGPLAVEGVYNDPVLVICGTKSPYKVLDGKDLMLKHFPNTVHVPVEGGTHTLHADFREVFIHLVCDFIVQNRK